MVLSPTAKRGRRTLAALFIVVALFIAGLYFYVQRQAQELAVGETPVALAARGEAMALPPAAAEAEMLYYYDDLYGFEVNYPAGYKAELDADFGVRLRFTANNPFSSFDRLLSAEVIDVSTSETASQQEVADNVFEGVEGYSLNETTLNNRRVILGRGETSGFVEPDERIFLRAGVFECRKPDASPYVAAVLAAVPESLQQDLIAVDYIISTFNCTGT
ncbi:MAG: hypothetical protein AB1626_01710 [Candidatus Micrarchaeota archaeon]